MTLEELIAKLTELHGAVRHSYGTRAHYQVVFEEDGDKGYAPVYDADEDDENGRIILR